MKTSYEIWDMSNRCKLIVYKRSKKNMVTILRWLTERYHEKKKFETFNYEEIHRKTGLNNKQVAKCCERLALKKNPFVRITVGECQEKRHKNCGLKPYYRVKLIRPLLSSPHADA